VKRGGWISRHTPLKSGKRIKAKPRTKQERTRIYGSDARQSWLRDIPCLVCWTLPVELAHTANGGMGKKGDADAQVPLCRGHHRESHQIGVASFETKHSTALQGRTLREWAGTIAHAWHVHSGLTPLSAIVPGVVAKMLEVGE
jgi:hypothetical protein